MKNFLRKITVILILLMRMHSIYARELCDCFGDCVQIHSRDVSKETKCLVKVRFGYSPYAKLDIDHKIPLCLGGSNNIDNLQPLSRYLHEIKTKHDLQLLYNVYSCTMTLREAQEEALNWKNKSQKRLLHNKKKQIFLRAQQIKNP